MGINRSSLKIQRRVAIGIEYSIKNKQNSSLSEMFPSYQWGPIQLTIIMNKSGPSEREDNRSNKDGNPGDSIELAGQL